MKTSELLKKAKVETKVKTLIDLFIATKQTEGKSPATNQVVLAYVTALRFVY
jgi:hypothetical protein